MACHTLPVPPSSLSSSSAELQNSEIGVVFWAMFSARGKKNHQPLKNEEAGRYSGERLDQSDHRKNELILIRITGRVIELK